MMKNLIISLVLSLFIVSLSNATTYYVSPAATGSGNGTQSNPFTLTQAINGVLAGDTVILAVGDYILSSSINFNKVGTSENPIVWIGTISANDLGLGIGTTINSSSDGSASTLIRNITLTSNGIISMSGAYNYFKKIVFEQDYAGGGTDGKNLISISGDYVQWDSCAFKYPSNQSSSSNHSVYVTGEHVILGHSSFYKGSRCIVWVQKADFFTMEYCKLTGATNHPPIQIFPNTSSSDTSTIKRSVVRNCLFIDNPYGDLYTRYLEQFAFYNNIFIRSGKVVGISVHTGFNYPYGTPEDTCNSKGGIIAYNTVVLSSSEVEYNIGTNQINKLNNLYYLTSSNLGSAFRYDAPFNAIYRHHFDYNLYYDPNVNFNSTGGAGVVWATNSYWFPAFKTVTGQETNSIYTTPTFTNLGSDDFSPLNSSSPQVGKGTPITTANGYWIDITTDYFGNPRDPNNPTIGAIEFSNGGVDITPPQVISALLINSGTLTITFSEPLALPGAENPSNYLINNGISVNSVSYSGNQATLQTTPHTTGSYIVTVNNITDIAGNLISPTNNTAQYNVQLDVTPPELLSASLIDSVILSLTFSEVLDPSTGQNINNYSISNGISVLGASFSGTQVTLSTSVHIPGNYSVTVNNITDLAGNFISSSANSVVYEMAENPQQGLVELPILSTTASVIPEPLHSPDKTIDGLGYYDGDPDSRWAGDTMPEWLVYDFGNVRILSTTRLSFYGWNEGRIYNYSLLVSTDSLNWSDVRTDIQSSSQEWTVQEIGTIEARYLKIIFISNNQNTWAGLWEANFLGMADTTPPEVSSASLTNSTTLVINFSEPMDPASSVVLSNYVIGSGVTINSASLSTDGKRVTLNTSQHTANQSYTVVVSNVKDLAGNIISSRNSAQYSFIENTVGNLKADVKVFLQGPFQSNIMITELSNNAFIPSQQPYNTTPWNYSGNESLPAGQAGLSVDWVLVELRSNSNPSLVVARRAGLLRNDGRIMEPDGTLGVTFNDVLYGSYYIAVHHRNHLAVMTSAPVLFSPDNILYDFTNSLTSAYGQNAMAEITAGVFGMFAGDGNGDGGITISDHNDIWLLQNGSFGYLKGDFNLDCGVTIHDVNLYWNPNNGSMSQVP